VHCSELDIAMEAYILTPHSGNQALWHITCLHALRRLSQRLPFMAVHGEALLAERLKANLERASAFVLAHEAAADDLRRCTSCLAQCHRNWRKRDLRGNQNCNRAWLLVCFKPRSALVMSAATVGCSAVRYEMLQDLDDDDDDCLDTLAMARKEAARESATRQVLDESAQVSAARPASASCNPQSLQHPCHAAIQGRVAAASA
jgi:hypothetical protein